MKKFLAIMIMAIIATGCCTDTKLAGRAFADSVGDEYIQYVEEDKTLGTGTDGSYDERMHKMEIKVRKRNLDKFKEAMK